MESSYKQRLDQMVNFLVSKLIKSVAGLEESSENYQIAQNFIMSNIKFHKFLETDRFKVEREFQGILEKFNIHLLDEESARLAELFSKFLQKNIKKDFIDVHYSILHLLLLLSNNPIPHNLSSKIIRQREKEVATQPPAKDEFSEAYLQHLLDD